MRNEDKIRKLKKMREVILKDPMGLCEAYYTIHPVYSFIDSFHAGDEMKKLFKWRRPRNGFKDEFGYWWPRLDTKPRLKLIDRTIKKLENEI